MSSASEPTTVCETSQSHHIDGIDNDNENVEFTDFVNSIDNKSNYNDNASTSTSNERRELHKRQKNLPLDELGYGITLEEVQIAKKVIEVLKENRFLLGHFQVKSLTKVVTDLVEERKTKPKNKIVKNASKKEKKEKNKALIAGTGMHKLRTHEENEALRAILPPKKEFVEDSLQLENENSSVPQIAYIMPPRYYQNKEEGNETTQGNSDDVVVETISEQQVDQDTPATESDPKVLNRERSCHICSKKYDKVHDFYHKLCPECGDFNYNKRFEVTDLRGKVAIVTGARVKIGYQVALKLLRCGCFVIATSRFPADTLSRYKQETDFEMFKDRLHIYGLDMRHIKSVFEFTDFIRKKYDRLDIIINNAAQTIHRPPAFYEHLLEREALLLEDNTNSNDDMIGANKNSSKIIQTDFLQTVTNLADKTSKNIARDTLLIESSVGDSTNDNSASDNSNIAIANTTNNTVALPPSIHLSAALSQIPVTQEDKMYSNNPELREKHFPTNCYDINKQQIDLREKNTWKLKIHEISPQEFVEVTAINSMAPFIINSRLKSFMEKCDEDKEEKPNKYILNVSSMEGQFYRKHKQPYHVHTNMAKASLNMMTRTSGQEYAKSNIYMNSVDTGWITNENPLSYDQQRVCPLDEVDAAARICDPIITNSQVHSQVLKDFKIAFW